jgi:hypothetical protein
MFKPFKKQHPALSRQLKSQRIHRKQHGVAVSFMNDPEAQRRSHGGTEIGAADAEGSKGDFKCVDSPFPVEYAKDLPGISSQEGR